MKSWDESLISQWFFPYLLFNLLYLCVKLLKDISKGNFLELSLWDFRSLLFGGWFFRLLIFHELLNLIEAKIRIGHSSMFSLLDKSYEGIINEQTP